MVTPAWNVAGQYFETCSCDFVCPCILTQMTAKPTKDSCTFAMGFNVEKGSYGATKLDGLGFVVIGFTPAEMGKGNWSAGVVVDDRANADQRDAIVAIATGQAGGPMAALSGLITTFAGVESSPIRFEQDGAKWSVQASTFVNMSAAPSMGLDPRTTSPLQLANTGHPANTTVWLSRAIRSVVAVFGLTWNDTSGRNSGQYAPFTWASS